MSGGHRLRYEALTLADEDQGQERPSWNLVAEHCDLLDGQPFGIKASSYDVTRIHRNAPGVASFQALVQSLEQFSAEFLGTRMSYKSI